MVVIRRVIQTAILAGWVAVTSNVFVAIAQDADKPADKPTMMPRDADPDWDVATVKPSDPNDNGVQHINLRGRHVMMMDTTVHQFLLMGYGLQESQLANEPAWTKTDRWNVDGVLDVAGNPDWTQMQRLMQKILVERFGLKARHEQREMPVFALTVAKGGEKVVPHSNDPNRLTGQRTLEDRGQRTEVLNNISMSDLALILQFQVSRPVVDRTGLNGRFDISLKWTYDDQKAPADGSAAPDLFTAIQEQLGLKLEPVKGQADALVVDAVVRPTAN